MRITSVLRMAISNCFLGIVICALLGPPSAAQMPQNSSVEGGKTYDGVTIAADLPYDQMMKNIGSKIDQAGMCVDTSVEQAARHQGLEQFRGFRDYWAKVERGGNHPAGLVRQIKAWCQMKGIPEVPYLQYEGPAPESVMELASKTGRLISLTYGWSPRYGRRVAHMINCPYFGPVLGTTLDNNFVDRPQDRIFEWMPREELVRRARLQMNGRAGSAWIHVWLAPPPPPPLK